MKLKFLPSITCFLCCILFGYSQNNSSSYDYDVLEITLKVYDIQNDSGTKTLYELSGLRGQKLSKDKKINLRLRLDYLSDNDSISYFGIKYSFAKKTDGLIGPYNNGTTVPVLIPPVMKDSLSRLLPRSNARVYPNDIYTSFTPEGDNYTLRIDLYKYNNQNDYNAETNPEFVDPVFFLDFSTTNYVYTHDVPVARADTFRMMPNPSKHFVRIEKQLSETTLDSSKATSLEFIIYNIKGVEVSRYVVSYNTNTSRSEPISTTHLPKGIYYCHIKNGDNTTVKTLIKN